MAPVILMNGRGRGRARIVFSEYEEDDDDEGYWDSSISPSLNNQVIAQSTTTEITPTATTTNSPIPPDPVVSFQYVPPPKKNKKGWNGKKFVRNAFFMFMQTKRKELEAEGKKFPGGWREVAEFLCEIWQNMSFEEQEIYKTQAENAQPLRMNRDLKIYMDVDFITNIGKRYEDVLKEEMIKGEKKLLDRIRISEMLTSMDPKDVTIVVMNISMYFISRGKLFVPAEIGLTAFSLQKGIIDNYWSLVDPYYIPMGYNFIVRNNCSELGLPPPKFSNRFQQYDRIICGFETFLKEHQNPVTNTTLVFCLNDEVKPYTRALDWLYDQCGRKHDVKLNLIGCIVQQLSDIGMMRRSAQENIPWSYVVAKHLNHDQVILVIIQEDDANDDNGSLTQQDSSSLSTTTITKTDSGESASLFETNLTDNIIHSKSQQQITAINKTEVVSNENKVDIASLQSNSSGYETESKSSHDEKISIKICQNSTENFKYEPSHDYKSRLWHPDRGFHTEKEVEDYLESQDLAFDSELACLYHNQPHREGIKYCPLLVTNRFAYSILASLTSHFGIKPMLGVHKYDRSNPRAEEDRRIKLLQEWGIDFEESNYFTYNDKSPSQYSTRLVDELHPKTYRVG